MMNYDKLTTCDVMLGINSHPVPSIELIMTRYSSHRRSGDYWYSPPFYTGPGGYKMCLRVDAIFTSIKWLFLKNEMFLAVHLIGGEYDSRLVWPFKGDITIQLVNHNNDHDHRETTVLFNDAAVASGASKRVTLGKRASSGSGGTLISQTDVESSNQYLINDCLTFRVTKIVVHSV